MIRGMHGMFYSSEPETLRAFFRDKLGFHAHDVGGGWLIAAFGPGVVPLALSLGSAFATLAALAAPAPPVEVPPSAAAGEAAPRFCRAFWYAVAAAACVNATHAALYAFGTKPACGRLRRFR